MRHAIRASLLVLLAATPAAAATAHAQGNKPQHDAESRAAVRAAASDAAVEQMMRADVNKDGTVSREEIERLDSRMSPRFNAADADRDGKLNLREFEKLRALSRGATSGTAPAGTAGGASSGRLPR